ncbi:MAG: hypothetical protein M3R13_10395 [Armatimonadota bacterium]|nr:hypothetical protein [Armatimonadota bacterium]
MSASRFKAFTWAKALQLRKWLAERSEMSKPGLYVRVSATQKRRLRRHYELWKKLYE